MKKLLLLLAFVWMLPASAQNNPELTVYKDDQLAYTQHPLVIGDVLTYNITVENTGNVTLTDININDDNATITGNNPIASLTAGSSITVTAQHVVTQDDIDAGQVVNQAIASCNFNGITISDLSDDTDPMSPSGNDDPTITFIVQNPELQVFKDDLFPYTPQNLQVGDIITYNIYVINTGNVTLTDITVTDDNATIINSNLISNLSPGTTVSIVATHTVTQDDIDTGQVVNQAIATCAFNGTMIADFSDDTDPSSLNGDNDPTITYIQEISGLSLTKLGYINSSNSICPKPGEDIIYTFEVRNTGNQTISNILINDPQITTPIEYISGDLDGDNKLGQNEIWVYRASYPLNQNIVDEGYFDNQASVHGIDPQGNTISDISDDPTEPTNIDLNNDGDPDDPTHTIIPQHADLILLKEGHFNDENGNGLADIGETITYNFTVKNRCNVTIKNIHIEDDSIDVNSTYINLGADEIDSQTFSGSYIITLTDLNRGYVENTATAIGYDPDNIEIRDISDDPSNSADIDVENDNEADDPTITILITPDPSDLDNDGIYDDVDIDDDNDGIPDLDEYNGVDPLADTDNDGIPAYLDDDDNDNTIGNANGQVEPAFDLDNDGILNHFDLDSDGDGLFDTAESGRISGTDTNRDGILEGPTGSNGLVDNIETTPDSGVLNYSLLNTDGDTNYDFLDIDDDNDHVRTLHEHPDDNGNHYPDDALDTDGEGKPNYLDRDDDGDGLYTDFEDVMLPHTYPQDGDPTNDDTDLDGIPNYLDTDDDNDEILTVDEHPDDNNNGEPDDAIDSDGDSIPDYLDIDNLNQIDEINQSIGLYPNPVKNTIFINTQFDIKNIQLFDLQGKQINIPALSSQNTIDMAAIKPGMYILKLQADEVVITQIILKK